MTVYRVPVKRPPKMVSLRTYYHTSDPAKLLNTRAAAMKMATMPSLFDTRKHWYSDSGDTRYVLTISDNGNSREVELFAFPLGDGKGVFIDYKVVDTLVRKVLNQ